MNYNFPYYGMMPISKASLPIRGASSGIFSRLIKGFNWGSILTNTQKTLNLVNQAIPLIKQANPIVKNAKTMFRVMNEFKKIDFSTSKPETNKSKNANNKIIEAETNTNNNQDYDGGPVFFV